MNIETIKNPDSHFIETLRRQEFRAAQKECGSHDCAMVPVNYALTDAQGKLMAGFSGKKFGNILEIDLLFTDKEMRRQGFGKEFLALINDWAAKHNCQVLSLWCTDWHTHQFWESMGFKLYGEIKDQPVGHQIYYFAKPVEPPSAPFRNKFDFLGKSADFYDELLPHMQAYEQDVIPHDWPEDAIAFQMKDTDKELAKAFGYTIWNYFYCDGLWFHREADAGQRLKFAEGLREACAEADLSGIRLNAFPWQSPRVFQAASFNEIAAPLPNPDKRFARRTFYVSGLGQGSSS